MRILNEFPAIGFAAAFIVGIILEKIFSFEAYTLFSILIIIAIVYLINKKNANYILLKRGIVVSAAMIVGAIVFHFNGNERAVPLFDLPVVKNYKATVEIISIHLPKKENVTLLIATDSSDKKFSAKKLLVRIKITRASFEKNRKIFSVGNKIQFSGFYNQGRDKRNPGEFDYRDYLLNEGITGFVFVKSIDDLKLADEAPAIFANAIFDFRLAIKKTIDNYFDSPTAALMNALIIADKSELSFETKKNFIETGVVHVLAVSGLHVAFVTIIFLFFFGRLEIVWRIVFTLVGLIFFLLITDSPSSVFRATVMAAVILISYPSGRSTYGINSLSVAALIILILNPSDLFNPGFQLSFSAVLSILILSPVLNNLFATHKVENRIIKYFLTFFAVSLAAQIGTLPFTTYYFSKISLVALAANFFVIPMIALILGGGIGVLIFSFLSNHIASTVALSVNLLTSIMNSLVNYFASFDYSYLRVPNFSMLDGIILLSFIIIFGIVVNQKRSVHFTILFAALLLLNADLFIQLDDENIFERNKLNVMMIDIGQGDAFLIKFPNGKIALLDAGNATPQFDNGEKIIQPLLEHLQIDAVDFALVSHMDADHYAGFHSLIKNGLIKKIIKPAPDTSFKKDLEFEKFAKQYHVPVSYYYGKTEIDPSVRIYNFVNHTDDGFISKTTNDRSSFFLLKYGEHEIIFTGDASTRVEKFVTKKFSPLLKADILKVGHHGSKTSSGENFLSFVQPKISLISAGINNKFKHPSKNILERLEKYSTEILRTDLSGAVLLISDGNKLEIKDWKKLDAH